MDSSCGCIWTPPLSDYTQIGVQFNCTPNQNSPTTRSQLMTIRERVLAGYGGPECRWCGTHDRPEIAHIAGGGNQHRKRIGVKLDVWLWRQFKTNGVWPVGYQILCITCHSRKSHRMPTKDGNKQVNIHLPDELALQLTTLAAAHDGSKSKAVESLLRAQLDGTVLHSTSDDLHQHLAMVESKLAEQLQRLTTLVQGMDQRLRTLEDYDQKRYKTLLQAFDRLKASGTKEERSGGWPFGLRRA
jgi:hypothetical protein